MSEATQSIPFAYEYYVDAHYAERLARARQRVRWQSASAILTLVAWVLLILFAMGAVIAGAAPPALGFAAVLVALSLIARGGLPRHGRSDLGIGAVIRTGFDDTRWTLQTPGKSHIERYEAIGSARRVGDFVHLVRWGSPSALLLPGELIPDDVIARINARTAADRTAVATGGTAAAESADYRFVIPEGFARSFIARSLRGARSMALFLAIGVALIALTFFIVALTGGWIPVWFAVWTLGLGVLLAVPYPGSYLLGLRRYARGHPVGVTLATQFSSEWFTYTTPFGQYLTAYALFAGATQHGEWTHLTERSGAVAGYSAALVPAQEYWRFTPASAAPAAPTTPDSPPPSPGTPG